MALRVFLTAIIGATGLVTAFVAPGHSPAASAVATPATDALPTLARFLIGDWHCVGGSPSGRKISSTLNYRTVLSDRWLAMQADDDAPGRYHAIGMWSVDTAAREVAMNVFDNFGGGRAFHGRWSGDSITWQRERDGTPYESFTYVRRAPGTYWYAWHISRTAGGPLVLGDSVTCSRK